MSPLKKYKLKPILITLKTTFWSIGQVLFEVWCNFKYYFILFAALRPTLCFSSSTFSYHFECSFLEQRNISKDIVSTSWLTSDALIQSLLTTVHPFLYVHFGFWILRIAIILTWNNYYNITNLPDYTWVKWNWFLALTTSSICSQWPHCLHMIQVSLFKASARKYGKNL